MNESEKRVKEVRFRKELRERKLNDGTTDRFWCVVDREQKGFIVLRVCSAYPGSELLAGAYALKLNSREADAASRIPKAEAAPKTNVRCANPICEHYEDEHTDGFGGCVVVFDDPHGPTHCICAEFVDPRQQPVEGEVLPNGKPATPENALLLRWNQAAAGVGICGSEYIDDPERVFARVRDNREALMRSILAAKASSSVVAGGESELTAQLYSALERLRKNAKHIFDETPVRDWAETLDETDAALDAYQRAQPLIKDVWGKE